MADPTSVDDGVDTPEQMMNTPAGVVRRWKTEWDMATQRERDWREESEKVWRIYESADRSGNSFNILWSNTETLRPAVYNSLPAPDVRRRFRDPDPVGKVASTCLERALTYSLDAYDFDHELTDVVLDVLLPGRGVARVKYEPVWREKAAAESDGQAKSAEPAATDAPSDSAEPAEDSSWLGEEEEAKETPDLELADEAVVTEHVPWDKFRHGSAKKWKQVPWVGFEHEMPYEQLCEMFGKTKAKAIKLTDVEVPDKQADGSSNKDAKTLFKVGVVREIWDKISRKVIFFSDGYTHGPLLEVDDPLEMDGFFPVPRPLYAIENSRSLMPGVLYTKYEEQAFELNRVSMRINKIINGLKIRGAYSAALAEVPTIIESADNTMVPIANASEVAAMGGLDKAIWMMPIDKLIQVLDGLYVAREKTIAAIYQITGLGDILRGVSNPHETLGAQKIKSQWGTLRLQRVQREVQRFCRDLLRMKAEVFAKHFDAKTLQQMTGIALPTAEQKAQTQQRLQQAQMPPAPPMPGMPPPPPPLSKQDQQALSLAMKLPTWDEVIQLYRSEAMRMYRIDVETDSTVSETVDRDMEGMQQAMTAVAQIFTTLAPMIERGALSVDVAKALAGEVARVARWGGAVEDAIEAIQQPPPPPPPPPDTSVQTAQIKSQADMQQTAAQTASAEKINQVTEQTRLQVEGLRKEARMAEIHLQGELKAQIAQLVEAGKASIAQMMEAGKNDREMAIAQMQASVTTAKSELDNAVKILVAAITAKTAEAAAEAKATETYTSEG